MNFKRFVKDYFTFSKGDRNGIIILLVICVVLIVLNHLTGMMPPKTDQEENERFRTQINNFEKSLRLKEIQEKVENRQKNQRKFTLFPFDPNHTSGSDWEKLGLKPFQIKIILNYTSKGGKFYHKEDLKKIYGISSGDYVRLEPYMVIAAENIKYKANVYPVNKPAFPPVELNSSDTAELKRLPGIGTALSARIVKYRQRLGGFSSKKQLYEVWGLSPDVISQLEGKIILDSLNIQKININKLSAFELAHHPYLRLFQAKGIVKYRELKGGIQNPLELVDNHLLTKTEYEKLKPYLSVQ